MAWIAPDTLNGHPVYLAIDERPYWDTDAVLVRAAAESFEVVSSDREKRQYTVDKSDYHRRFPEKEQQYLNKVFTDNGRDIRFNSRNGNYELFYPYQINGKTIGVLWFTDSDYYGKLGLTSK